MSARDERRFERVCVALEAASSARDALDAAASLAVELDAELAGFFLEDVNVLRAAALPFTREMGLASGVFRPMQLEEVERALRAQARAAQSLLARMAEGMQLRWSFTTVRGAGLAPMLASAGATSLTVIAPRSGLLEPRAFSTPPARDQAPPAACPVAVLFDGSEAGLHAVRVAAIVASARTAPLTVLLFACSDRDSAALREMLEEALGSDAPSVRYATLAERSPVAIAAAARQARAAVVLVGTATPGIDARHLADLLGRLDCPLMVVSQ